MTTAEQRRAWALTKVMAGELASRRSILAVSSAFVEGGPAVHQITEQKRNPSPAREGYVPWRKPQGACQARALTS